MKKPPVRVAFLCVWQVKIRTHCGENRRFVNRPYGIAEDVHKS